MVEGEGGAARDVQLVVGEVGDAGGDDRREVVEHPLDGLAGPAEDQVDARRQAELVTPLDGLEDLVGPLPAAAQRDQLVGELLGADADPVDSGGLHRRELLAREELGDPFESDLGRRRSRPQNVADQAEQTLVAVGRIEVGRAAAEIDAVERAAVELVTVELPLQLEVAQVLVELRPVPEHLAGEEAEAAAVGPGGQAEGRRDVEDEPLGHRDRRPPPSAITSATGTDRCRQRSGGG